MAIETDVKKVGNLVEDYVNNMGYEPEKLAQHFAGMHRTLQQCFMRVVICFLKIQAKAYEEGDYDLRNERTCKLCKDIVDRYSDDLYVPFI